MLELCYASLAKLFDLQPIQHQQQASIRHIIDTVNDVIRAMKNLTIDTTNWDPIINYIIRKNLDNRTRTEFEKTLADDKQHETKVLMEYLNNLATALGTASSNPRPQKGQDKKKNSGGSLGAPHTQEESGPSGSTQSKPRFPCCFCNEQHINARCPTLIPMSVQQRLKIVLDKKLCKNCLAKVTKNHNAAICHHAPCGTSGCTERHPKLLHEKPSAAPGRRRKHRLSCLLQ